MKLTYHQIQMLASRRQFLTTSASGLGGIALSSLLSNDLSAAKSSRTDPLAPKDPHFRKAPAKACIFVYLAGAPSQFELFNYKPKLVEHNGETLPDSLTEGVRFAFINKNAKVLASKREFKQHGQSGMWFSDALPHLSSCADDICMIHSMKTEAFNHHPGQLAMCCGMQQFGRPSIGSWVTYGLGSESENLPGYVVLTAGGAARGGATLYTNGFLPSSYGGVLFRNQGEPVLNLNNPAGLTTQVQRSSLDALADLNKERLGIQDDGEIQSRIDAYELAFRMQTAAPELIDTGKESQATLESYGPGDFAKNCLLARRLVERGVRFVNIFHGGWDAHGGLAGNINSNAKAVDQGMAALIKDLKQRGMLDETLVVWGTEFGRTPLAQGNDGRDHHPFAFSMWMAGGGSKPGYTHGKSDDLGWHVAENPVHVNDFQATLLKLFGLDDKKLTFRFKGLDNRLTGVGESGHVVDDLIA
jgi:hypothetical protein